MPLVPVLGRQKQMGLCDFEISQVYKVSSRQPEVQLGRHLKKGNHNKILQKGPSEQRHLQPSLLVQAQPLGFHMVKGENQHLKLF